MQLNTGLQLLISGVPYSKPNCKAEILPLVSYQSSKRVYLDCACPVRVHGDSRDTHNLTEAKLQARGVQTDP
jgi:hypothetical protein